MQYVNIIRCADIQKTIRMLLSLKRWYY